MPVRATKRGAERTRFAPGAAFDVVICGASFAGLAVALINSTFSIPLNSVSSAYVPGHTGSNLTAAGFRHSSARDARFSAGTS